MPEKKKKTKKLGLYENGILWFFSVIEFFGYQHLQIYIKSKKIRIKGKIASRFLVVYRIDEKFKKDYSP